MQRRAAQHEAGGMTGRPRPPKQDKTRHALLHPVRSHPHAQSATIVGVGGSESGSERATESKEKEAAGQLIVGRRTSFPSRSHALVWQSCG